MNKNIKNIFLAFIIGSSVITFINFFIGLSHYIGKFNKNNCVEKIFGMEPYVFYTFVAPFYLGFYSSIGAFLHLYFNLNITLSYLLVGIIGAIITSILITYCQIYNFTPKRLRQQYLRLQIYYFLIFSVIVANTYRYLLI